MTQSRSSMHIGDTIGLSIRDMVPYLAVVAIVQMTKTSDDSAQQFDSRANRTVSIRPWREKKYHGRQGRILLPKPSNTAGGIDKRWHP